MSFSRNIFDEESYKQSINQSVGPGIYNIHVPKHSCEPCYTVDPTVRMQKRGVSHLKDVPLVDVDSELSGINRKLSRNIYDCYMPTSTEKVCNLGEVNQPLTHWKDCRINVAEDTRLTNPSCNLRGTGWNRWEHIISGNPQEHIERPLNFNISNRILVKDNHRPCIPTPIDPSPLLPLGGEMPCEQTTQTCAATTRPASVHWQTKSNMRQL